MGNSLGCGCSGRNKPAGKPNQLPPSDKDGSSDFLNVAEGEAKPRAFYRRSSTSALPGHTTTLNKPKFVDALAVILCLAKLWNNIEGQRSYLCFELKKLYRQSPQAIEMYLPQLCNLVITDTSRSRSVEKFLKLICSKSVHFALQVSWLLLSVLEDHTSTDGGDPLAEREIIDPSTCDEEFLSKVRDVNLYRRCARLLLAIENAVVNYSLPTGRTFMPLAGTATADSMSLASESTTRLRRSSSQLLEGSASELEEGPDEGSQSSRFGAFTPLNASRGLKSQSSFLSKISNGSTMNGAATPASASAPALHPTSPNGDAHSDRDSDTESVAFSVQSFATESTHDDETERARISKPLTEEEKEWLHRYLEYQALFKKGRCDYYNAELNFVSTIVSVARSTQEVVPDGREAHLRRELEALNFQIDNMNFAFQNGVYIPISRANDLHHKVLRVPSDEAVIFSTNKRSPVLLYIEVLEGRLKCSSPYFHQAATPTKVTFTSSDKSPNGVHRKADAQHNVEDSRRMSEGPISPTKFCVGSVGKMQSKVSQWEEVDWAAHNRRLEEEEVWGSTSLGAQLGEKWSEKLKRMKSVSPYGHVPGWSLIAVIAKVDDDLRQELFANQLIGQFKQIFGKEGSSLWLRPYSILVTSASSGLIEVIPDAVSLHALKRTEGFTSLRDHFKKTYGPPESREFKLAQRNYIESMAAYSVVCYILNIKDRHNGNLLIDKDGRLIHIDFGFMLSNSPGNLGFETAPFKLSKELVEVIVGDENIDDSQTWKDFKSLCFQAFQYAHKHVEEIILLVDMMFSGIGREMPCFVAETTVSELRARFHLHLRGKKQLQSFVEGMIDESLDNWRTKQYDNYQKLMNGIL